MKTATLTLHTAHNNGSFLQSFALQKKIKSLGHDNDLINFVPPAQYPLYQNIIFKDRTLKGLIKGGMNLPHYRTLTKRKDNFNQIHSLFSVTKKFEDEGDFNKIITPYDCIIAGSDQIWNNATMPDFTPLYLLPTDKFKISYAPSFGKSLKNQFDAPDILESINKIDCVSVREKSAKEALSKKLPEKDIEVVLDPTFLLDKDDYQILENRANCKYDGEYIFFYCIKASNEVLITVKEIGKLLNLPIITVFTGVNTYKCQAFGQKVDFAAGPAEFVSYIKNAKYVISNSFHGIVFSIIYNKIFYRVADNQEGRVKIDERLDSILTILGLEKQNIVAKTQIFLNKDLEFEKVNEKLEVLKQQSSDWLDNSIQNSLKKRN